jgi:lipoyl(octanoyl) transferase
MVTGDGSRDSRPAGLGVNSCAVVDLGLLGYAEAYALQRRVVALRKTRKIGDVLLTCEHPHTITLGRSGKIGHLLAGETVLRQKGVEFHHSDRGGDITYHGPGQLVGYPIVDLAAIRRDVGWYVRMLEEAMIRASADFAVVAHREAGKTGIWVAGSGNEHPEKLAAIGVHLSRWITSHGFAFNVATDLRYFDLIVPCGIAGRTATSLEKLLGRAVPVPEAAGRVTRHLGDVLGREMHEVSAREFLDALAEAEACEAAPEECATMAAEGSAA